MADRATPLSLAHHSYFNLGGHGAGRAALYNHTIRSHTQNKKEGAMINFEIKHYQVFNYIPDSM